MAAPTVAGALALLYAIDENMTPAKIISLLENGELTEDIGEAGYDTSFGYGRLNLAKAIESISEDESVEPESTYFYTEPPSIDFGNLTTQLDIELKKVGSGSVSVTNLTADDATGLSYSSDVDAEGVGTYTIYINRSEIPDGLFQNRIYFNFDDSTRVSVGTYYQVGANRTRPDLGKVFVGLGTTDSEDWVAYADLDFDGFLVFIANDIVDGDYYFLISTDFDDDGWVCDVGEICAYYPEYGSNPETFEIAGEDISGPEIPIRAIFNYGGINAASTNKNVEDDGSKTSGIRKPEGQMKGSILIDQQGTLAIEQKEKWPDIPVDAIPMKQN